MYYANKIYKFMKYIRSIYLYRDLNKKSPYSKVYFDDYFDIIFSYTDYIELINNNNDLSKFQYIGLIKNMENIISDCPYIQENIKKDYINQLRSQLLI